jgi:hypothetical protein
MLKKLKARIAAKRNEVIEANIVAMLIEGTEYSVWQHVPFDTARAYAKDKGAKATDSQSASTRFELGDECYFVVFTRSAGRGTVVSIEDAAKVDERMLDPLKRSAHIDQVKADVEKAFSEFGDATRYEATERLIFKDIQEGIFKKPKWAQDENSFENLINAAYDSAMNAGMDMLLATQWMMQKDLGNAIVNSAARFEDAGYSRDDQIANTCRVVEKLAKAQLRAEQRRRA